MKSFHEKKYIISAFKHQQVFLKKKRDGKTQTGATLVNTVAPRLLQLLGFGQIMLQEIRTISVLMLQLNYLV